MDFLGHQWMPMRSTASWAPLELWLTRRLRPCGQERWRSSRLSPMHRRTSGALVAGFEMSSTNKIAVFTDGANIYVTTKALGFDVDYMQLLLEMQRRGNLVRAFYYTTIIEDQEYSSIRPLLDWLDYNGYTVVTKATKEFIDASGRRKVKGNMDIELAVDAMELAEHVDQIVLFSGDGDFRSLVQAVQRRGVRVVVVSSISTQSPMIAQELRRQADEFIDIKALQNKISRDPVQRPAIHSSDSGVNSSIVAIGAFAPSRPDRIMI